jgi:tRNA-modifying protein YgfZ
MRASDAARQGVLLRTPELSTLVVSGGDRVSWLNGLVTCELTGLAPGQGRWGLALNKQGKVQSELCIVAGEQRLFVGHPSTVQLASYLDQYLIMEDAELSDGSEELGWIMLHGPKAAESAARLARKAAWGSVDLTGLGGAAVVVSRSELPAALEELLTQPDSALASAEDWERLRVERTLPELGVDYQTSDNPHEASLERRAVSWTKGCYLGQEVVCMQDMRGKVKRRIVTLVLDRETAAAPGSPVHTPDGQTAGEVTTSVHSDVLGKPAALARLSTAFTQPGTELVIADRRAWILDQPA